MRIRADRVSRAGELTTLRRIRDREAKAAEARESEARRLWELKERAEARMADVDARLEALGILDGVQGEYEYRLLRDVTSQGDPFDLEFEVRDMQTVHEREEALRRAEAERKTRLDAMLTAAGLPIDEGSRHYARCVQDVHAPLDAVTIAEFRFIHQLGTAPHGDELARIAARLAKKRAYCFDHDEQARREFRHRFHVDADGHITGSKRKRRH